MGKLKACEIIILSLHFLLTFFQVASPESTGFCLKLIPWDSPKSPLYQPNLTPTQKLHMMVMSSKSRALKDKTFYSNKIKIPVNHHGLRYAVNIKIGKPPKEVTLLLDTGSGLIWTRCQHSKSDFNPVKSKNYRAIPCQHPSCKMGNNMCKCVEEQCVCRLRYGAKGGIINKVEVVLSSDSFTLPMKDNSTRTFTDMIFGCSAQSPIYSGILGLNKLSVSLISQVKQSVRGRYSYCLNGEGGFLTFGNGIPRIGKDAKTTKILHPDKPNMFLDLTDISIAQKRLGLSPALFSYEQGGFFIDTGSPLTVLKKQAYEKVIQEFKNYYKGKLEQVNEANYHLHLCYKRNPNLEGYARMTFHLEGADYETDNLFVISEPGIMCIGLIPGEVSILGAYQQWNKRFIFDINANVLEFVSDDCSNDRG